MAAVTEVQGAALRLGELIHAIRKRREETLADFGAELGRRDTTISAWERGSMPPIDVAARLAEMAEEVGLAEPGAGLALVNHAAAATRRGGKRSRSSQTVTPFAP